MTWRGPGDDAGCEFLVEYIECRAKEAAAIMANMARDALWHCLRKVTIYGAE